MNNLSQVPVYLWILLGIALLAQGTWIFLDASKRGENKWLWGIFGLINTPGNLIIYLIVTRMFLKTKPCLSCKKYVRQNFNFCPHCGNKIGG